MTRSPAVSPRREELLRAYQDVRAATESLVEPLEPEDMASTGERAVSVMTNGEVVGTVGYVTSHNGLSVIVVQSDGALFSQYIRTQDSVP